jgi:protein-disulfide isomerase
MKKIVAICSIVFVVAVFVFCFSNEIKSLFGKKSDLQNESLAIEQKESEEDLEKLNEIRKNSNLLKILQSDFVLGDKNASITVIEYASLSCPHCAAFTRESFEKLKTEYIDSGKVNFVYRDFPLNQPALTAALFAICQAEDDSSNSVNKYYSTIKALFRTQDSWAFDQKYITRLQSIAQLDGMDAKRFDRCINDEKLQQRILNHRMEVAKTISLQSTPSFFVNGEISQGYVDYQTIKKLIDKKIAEQEHIGRKELKK